MITRLHENGSFSLAHAGRYRRPNYGTSLMLDFTAPLRTLQITGAPTSPHAKRFRLPEQPWGHPADLAFLSLKGGPAHRPSPLPRHLDLTGISSWHLTQAMKWTLEVDPSLAPEMAKLSSTRLDDIRKRELKLQIKLLRQHARKLGEPETSRINQAIRTLENALQAPQ